MTKQRTLEELRQSKGYGYRPPVSHNDYEFVTHRFTESKLITYIEECMIEVLSRDSMLKTDFTKIKDFVKNNKT
tara:strand:- start:1105 stop:1326 length:222 start_codon:yes stop_codon:yes gene_type:complete